MREFDHIGIPSTEKHMQERFVTATKTWVTDPHLHPFSVEWLRFERDTTAPEIIQNHPHIAYRVDDIVKEGEGLEVLIAPFHSVAGHMVGFYKTHDGAIVELMMYEK